MFVDQYPAFVADEQQLARPSQHRRQQYVSMPSARDRSEKFEVKKVVLS